MYTLQDNIISSNVCNGWIRVSMCESFERLITMLRLLKLSTLIRKRAKLISSVNEL